MIFIPLLPIISKHSLSFQNYHNIMQTIGSLTWAIEIMRFDVNIYQRDPCDNWAQFEFESHPNKITY